MQQEDGDSKSGGGNQLSPGNYDDDDELIDMDDCPSDDEWKIVLMDLVIGWNWLHGRVQKMMILKKKRNEYNNNKLTVWITT